MTRKAGLVPFSKDDHRLMWKYASSWGGRFKHRSSSAETYVRTHFRPTMTKPMLAFHYWDVPDLDLRRYGWLVGEDLTRQPGVLPVINLQTTEQNNVVVSAAFRVALIGQRTDETISAEGWRFERAEPVGHGTLHPFQHAQSIIGWTMKGDCLIHPPHDPSYVCEDDGIHSAANSPNTGADVAEVLDTERLAAKKSTLESHPAFPLGVKTLTGLSLAMLVTLYGAARTRELLAEVPGRDRLDPVIAADLAGIGIAD